MRKTWVWAVVALLFLAMPALAQKDDKKDSDVASKEEIAQLKQAGQATGKITAVDAAGKKITFRLEFQKLEAGTTGKPGSKPNVKVVTDRADFEITLSDDAKIRMTSLPAVFDDKGNPKTYSKDEIAKLRGKDGYYNGDMSSLSSGQLVKVVLARPAPKKDKNDKTDDGLKAAQVIILGQAPAAPGDGKTPKK